jgi:two-component system chemotaxis response regulator CheY
MRVLVVDDSTYIRSRIKAILENDGHTVVGLAENGEKAIDMALELMPDLITLDNILPDMTGIDVLKALKDQVGLSKIVMISAVGQQSAIAEGLSCGASDYLVKPFQDTDLVEIIQKIVKD